MKVGSFVFGNMKENCHVLYNEYGEAVIFDPGMTDEEENGRLFSFISRNGLTPLASLVTHPHFDHICGAAGLCGKYGIECFVNLEDKPVLDGIEDSSALYGVRQKAYDGLKMFTPGPDGITLGHFKIDVIPVSGHTEGSLAFSCPGFLIAGDTLVKGSLGFLETGYSLVLERIRDYLLPLSDDTIILYGHGESSTIREEKARNRFFLRSAKL